MAALRVPRTWPGAERAAIIGEQGATSGDDPYERDCELHAHGL
jgi:hypothetical protein